MSICARVVVAVSFQQVYDTPDAETRAERNHQRLQHFNCRIKKLHPKTRSRAAREAQAASPAPASFHLINESSRFVLGFVRFLRLHLRRLSPNRRFRTRRTPRLL